MIRPQTIAKSKRQPTLTARFGNVCLPKPEMVKNFLWVGSVGTGKSLSMLIYLNGVIPSMTPQSGICAIIANAKRDMVGWLKGMNPELSIHILDPADARCVAWDVARDINSPKSAQSLSEILCPEAAGGEREPFWRNNAVALIKGVIVNFTRVCPGQWELRDAINAFDSETRLVALLKSDALTQKYARALEEADQRTKANLLATVRSYLSRYETVSALWHTCKRKISLEQVLQGGCVLLLGVDYTAPELIHALNDLIVTRLSQLLMNRPDCPNPWCFIILDEFCRMGRFRTFGDLATYGRSKGVSLGIAFQSICDVYETYGRNMAETIGGQFWYKAVFKLADTETALWGSRLIGNVERNSHLEASKLREVSAALASEFQAIAPPVKSQRFRQGLTGCYMGHWVWWGYTPSAKIDRLMPKRAKPLSSETRDFIERSTEEEHLHPWTETDFQRLNHMALLEDGTEPSDLNRELDWYVQNLQADEGKETELRGQDSLDTVQEPLFFVEEEET